MYSINYTLKPTELKTRSFNGKENFITHVYWRMIGVDSNDVTGVYDSATCIADNFGPETDLSNYVEFEDVTEEMLLTWVKSIMDEKVAQEWVREDIKKQAIKDSLYEVMPWESDKE